MSDDNPSAISHVSIDSYRFEAARDFYDAVLATLGVQRLMEHPGAAAYGKRIATLVSGMRSAVRTLMRMWRALLPQVAARQGRTPAKARAWDFR